MSTSLDRTHSVGIYLFLLIDRQTDRQRYHITDSLIDRLYRLTDRHISFNTIFSLIVIIMMMIIIMIIMIIMMMMMIIIIIIIMMMMMLMIMIISQ